VEREVRLSTAINKLHSEELKLDEKHMELDEVLATYSAMMRERQVRISCHVSGSLRSTVFNG